MQDMNEAVELVFAPLYLFVLVIWGMAVLAASPVWVPVLLYRASRKRHAGSTRP